MRITNIYNLPAPLVKMAQREYKCEPNEYRVTSLLKGVRETILERRYYDEIEKDVSEMIWLLFGTAVHGVLENQQSEENEITEQRLKVQIGDYILSGQFDLYNKDTGIITDYKTASVWKIIFGDYSDWRRQTLIYAYMLRQKGYNVKGAEIIAILKDHTKRDAKYKKDYPKLPVRKIEFWFTENDFAEIEQWLIKRFEEIAEAEKLPDNALPLCTAEERFNSDKYAVMKKGRKTALRVFDDRKEAEDYLKNVGGDEIEIRLGEDKKCADYCNVNKFCEYYKIRYGGA